MEKNNQNLGWWAIKFKLIWPPQKNPQWHVDLLIAHRIISPTIIKFENQLSYWRFHRRAAQDDSGHQFTFLFYSSQETANKVFSDIESHLLINELINYQILMKTISDDTSDINHPDIQEMADPSWTPLIKKTWSHFIMGVSQMWLAQIDEIAKSMDSLNEDTTIPSLLESYDQINNVISTSWQEQGMHAYLHHLNAIYGYVPLKIIDVSLRQF